MLHGLNDEEVLESRQKFGDNKIIEAEPETFLDKFKDAFGDPMIKLLLAIACIMAIMAFFGYAEWGELIGIVISVLLVTGISAKTEMSSDNEYRKLKDGTKKELCKVYRNGKIVEIEVDDYTTEEEIDELIRTGVRPTFKIKVTFKSGEAYELMFYHELKSGVKHSAIEKWAIKGLAKTIYHPENIVSARFIMG